MPQRPRQHQIEDESRTALRSALPGRWVFRDSVPDYGIDGEVELFDEGNHATGKLFKVQLKATDKSPLATALGITFPIETCRYYKSLDLPILIVRYHAPARSLYAKWFHTFDPYYGRKGKKTITFKLTTKDKWTKDTPSRLDTDLSIIREVRRGQLPSSIDVVVLTEHKTIHGIPADQMLCSIRKAAAEINGAFRFTHSIPNRAHIKLSIGNDMTEVNIAGLKSCTYHTRNKYPKIHAATKFHFDVMILIALALGRAKNFYLASRLIEQFAEGSHIVLHSQIAFEITACLVRGHRISQALKLSETLLDRRGSELSGQILFMAAYMREESLPKDQFDDLVNFLTRRIAWSEKLGNSSLAATAHYNLGNAIRGRNRRLALHHYREAYEFDPNYGEKEYFCRELGGILFASRRYRLAAEFYKRAAKKERKHLAVYADALMFTGKYREAQEAFDSYLGSPASANNTWSAEWRLKRWALDEVRTRLGYDEQKREPILASKRLPKAIKHTADDKETIEAVLSIDGLNWIAWEDLGHIGMKAGKPSESVLPFMMTALLRRHVGGWMNTLLGCIASQDHWFLIQDIITTAYLVQGEEFFEKVVTFSQAHANPMGSGILELVKEGIKNIPKDRPQAPTIRILGPGAQYTVLGSHSIEC